MGEKLSNASSIEWTDATWNPVRGCVKVSAGCKNCYAETFAERWRGVKGHPYEQGFDLRLVPEKLEEPLHWKKPRRVFVNSMSDLFQDGVDSEFITRVFSVMAAADWHTFQILTKRPLRMFRYIESHKRTLSLMSEVWPFPNVWLGVSVENKEAADERIPLLLNTPAAVRFVSYEPALGPVDLVPYMGGRTYQCACGFARTENELNFLGGNFYYCHKCSERAFVRPSLDWLICGGESGPSSRPFEIQWARDVIAQCAAAGTACFVKQLGARPMERNDRIADIWTYADGSDMDTVEGPRHPEYQYQGGMVTLRLRDRKGGSPEEWPSDLRIRQFPNENKGLLPAELSTKENNQ